MPGFVGYRAAASGERAQVRSFAAWRDAIQGLFPGFDPQQGDPDDFHGDFMRCTVGDLGLTEMGASSYVMAHDRLDPGVASKPGCCLILQIDGLARMSQAGRDIVLSPGDLTLIDGTRPARFFYERRYRQLAVQLPYRSVVGRLGEDMPSARLMPRSEAVPSMLRDMIVALFKGASSLHGSPNLKLGDTLLDLVDISLEQIHGTTGLATSDSPEAQLLAIKYFVRENLGDPKLDPQSIAKAHGISLRQLYRLFSATGAGVSEWILEQRLERCRSDLRDPSMHAQTIGDIAFNWGFNSFSHFSRTFKQRYGLAPRDWRLS